MIINYYSACGEKVVYIVRYLFHPSGELSNVKHWVSGKEAYPHGTEKMENIFLKELEPYQLCDIRVRLFQVSIDGIRFGLVYSEETQSVDLEPGPLITFMAPWDGEYYT